MSLAQHDVVASIEILVFVFMGLVVIPLVYSYLRKGKETDNVSFHAGDTRSMENWRRSGDKFPFLIRWGSNEAYTVSDEWLGEQLRRDEERDRREHTP